MVKKMAISMQTNIKFTHLFPIKNKVHVVQMFFFLIHFPACRFRQVGRDIQTVFFFCFFQTYFCPINAFYAQCSFHGIYHNHKDAKKQ